MKRAISLAVTMAVGSALAADVTYTEPPADTAMIKVSGGTTTVAGLEAYSHLTHYWSFDDENDPYADSVGDLPLQAMKSGDPVWKTGENAKRGGAMWTGQGLRTATNFIDGKHPFTICFWYKYGNLEATASRGQESLLHIGKVPNGAEVNDTPYLRVSHHNSGKPTTIDLWNNQITHAGTTISAFTSNVWHHIALVCTVVEAPDCVTSNRFTVYRNGSTSAAALTVAQQDFELTDKFLLGMGYHYGNSERPVYDATFDEVMCFDRALTSAELATFATYRSPVDFSAGWDITADGTLDIFGREPLTALKGEGVAKTLEMTQLEPSSNAWFAGSVQSPAFTFAGESSVTQTLSGANAWTGATTVESGTLEIAASPVEVFGNALVAWYPFEDATKPGRDFSPRGNHLTPQDTCIYEVTAAAKPFADAGQNLSVSNEKQAGFRSASIMDGFTAGQDNSFTVSFWMRGDAYSRDVGSIYFDTGSGTGIIAREAASLRFGDSSGPAVSYGMSENWDSGIWHHWALVYDAAAAAQGTICYYLFIDGACKSKSASHLSGNLHGTGYFYIARGFGGSGGPFKGALDEVVVLNTANTNDVAKLYALRRTQPEASTDVLPTGTAVTVEEGATLKLTAANETVAQLYGKGTIDLSGNSKLTVTKKDRFEGTVIGGTITDAPGAERQGLFLLVR